MKVEYYDWDSYIRRLFLYWAKDSPAWNTLWYSIIKDDGSPIWPERFPREELIQLREYASVGNINGFYQEYMNIAQSPDEAPFKPEWIKLHQYDLERRMVLGIS